MRVESDEAKASAADAFLRVHRNLRSCESSLYQAHADCAAVAGERVQCACGRWFVHVHTATEGCYWLVR